MQAEKQCGILGGEIQKLEKVSHMKSKEEWRLSLPLVTTIVLFGGFYLFGVHLVGTIIE